MIRRFGFGFSINIVLDMANDYRALVIIYGLPLVEICKHDYIRKTITCKLKFIIQ